MTHRPSPATPQAPTAPVATPARSAQSTVRRIIVIVLLFALVIVTAIGLSGLLGRLLDPNAPLAGIDPTSLALWLAFALVGAPLTALLWWLAWRRVRDPGERGSLAWGLYLAAASTVALIVALTTALTTLAALVEGTWLPESAAIAIVWSAVWVAHRAMRVNHERGTLRLTTVSAVIASWYGLAVAAISLAGALSSLITEALRGVSVPLAGDVDWWRPTLQGLIWAAGGGLVWAWHWFRERVRTTTTVFSSVALVLVGILAASVAALAGAGTLLFVGLRFAADFTDPVSIMLEPVDDALAALLVGSLVWIAHARVLRRRGDDERTAAVRSAAALVLSGVGVAATATGIGIIINAALAAVSPALVGSEPRTLLLGGISTFVVGAPLWWIVWRPTRGALPAAAASPGRRIYLVALFGISAAVALVTLLVIGYRVFEFLLAEGGSGIVDRIRAPLGILVATLLVAAYHFAIWRRDRARAGATDHERGIRRVVLVAASADPDLASAIRSATGASVTVWLRAVEGQSAPPAVSPAAVVDALTGLHAERVLVVTAADGSVEAIPLAD